MMDRHQYTFLDEARELLVDLEEALLAIERAPEDAELIGRIFRAMHTLKGSSAMFGYTGIAAFAHEMESAFNAVREGRMKVTPALITLTLASRDHLSLLLDCAEAERPPDPAMVEGGERILKKLETLLPSGVPEPTAPAAPAGSPGPAAAEEPLGPRMLYRVRFKPPENIYLTGSNPQYLIDEVKELGECEAILHSDGLPPPEELNPDLCYFRWDLLVSTARDERAIRDIFIFVEDESELRIECLGESGAADRDTWHELVEILRKAEDAPLAALQKAIAPLHAKPGPAGEKAGPRDPAQQEHRRIQNVKVPAERLDKLVNLVGELVTAQARLDQAATSSGDPTLASVAEQVGSLVWELRETTMSIRLLPIGTTFGKFQRLVRDLSAELGKEIHLVTEGEDTELDKSVIERLGDPIVHMIRNSVDHGVETPADRMASGKPRVGMIRLSAEHAGTSVRITVSDDGRGLSTAAIRRKAESLGLIQPDALLSEQELYALIFRPGFSTAATVSSVSGRGVGMDVVRQSIEEMGGQVEVASTPGKGTSFTLKLPLTLAIVEGLLVEVGREFFILPLAIVQECVELPEEHRRRSIGGNTISLRGSLIPYVRLRDFYQTGGSPPRTEYVVIVDVGGMQVGLTVDAVRGQHQTVIKTLGAFCRKVEGVSGATILGDGSVALIVDVPRVVSAAVRESPSRTAAAPVSAS